MKKVILVALFLVGAILLVPLSQLENRGDTPSFTAESGRIPGARNAAAESFRIANLTADTVTVLSAEEYLFGVVAAEMPALYENEALKAQAVAAYTYACYRRAGNAGKTYDLTTDSTLDQSYLSEQDARKRWGDKADEYSQKIKTALSQVKGTMVTYDGKPILAVYHAISPGKTEDCQTVWGGQLPYLKPVASPGDTLSPDYISTVSFTAQQLRDKLSEECSFSGEEASYFGKPQKTASGVVKEISVCGRALKGARVRSLLNLRSSAFEVAYRDSSFVFTVYGYGHGVGMSQYGANYMAKQGSTYEEILTYYYTGCAIYHPSSN